MPKASKPRKKLEQAERRERVAEMYRSRMSQGDMAKALGCNQATVSRDVAWLTQQHSVRSKSSFDAARAEMLSDLDRDEQELLKQYRVSGTVRRKDKLTGKMEFVRDTQIFQRINDLRKERAKLLGLYEPEKHQLLTDEIHVSVDK